jgi:hypothetical protein
LFLLGQLDQGLEKLILVLHWDGETLAGIPLTVFFLNLTNVERVPATKSRFVGDIFLSVINVHQGLQILGGKII